MTGTWRDTLFVWNGILKFSNSDEPDNESLSAEWSGTWIGCRDCPDARTAATPTVVAFSASAMKFEVQGTAKVSKESSFSEQNEKKVPFVTASLTNGSGWDLAGDDGETVVRHGDHVHDIFFPSQHYIEDLGGKSKYNVVVAKGENDFGSFISAGQRRRTDNNSNSNNQEFCLILGRRYLDEGDERAKWSLQQLYNVVVEEFSQIEILPRASITSGKPFSPWRCLSLHAEKKTKRKRKRGTELSPTSSTPPLYMPAPDGKAFQPQLKVTIRKTDNGSYILKFTAPNVVWEYQCWGCGGPATEEKNCDPQINFGDNNNNNNNAHCDFMHSEFCSSSCCLKLVPELVRVSKEVQKQVGNNCLLPVTNVNDTILQAIKDDKTALKSMEEAGWKMHEGVWRLG